MRNKKGDYKYGIILSLILGLMILSLSLYFIFNEYSTNQDIDQEICRQSIQLRSLLPEANYAGFNWKSFKEDYPLKCKMIVKTIDENDIKNNKAKKIIAESLAECWALYDKGDSSAFPSRFYNVASICVPCARIRLTEDAKKYMRENNIEINIRNSLDLEMRDGYSYYSYLNNSGKKFPAFNPAFARPFNLSGDEFVVDNNDQFIATLRNRLTGGVDGGELIFGLSLIDISSVSLPRIFNQNKGDLLINYGIITYAVGDNNVGGYIPYLSYFQAEQNLNPFNEVKKQLFDGFLDRNVNFCENWEGIPA